MTIDEYLSALEWDGVTNAAPELPARRRKTAITPLQGHLNHGAQYPQVSAPYYLLSCECSEEA
jgi:hypothetical protein